MSYTTMVLPARFGCASNSAIEALTAPGIWKSTNSARGRRSYSNASASTFPWLIRQVLSAVAARAVRGLGSVPGALGIEQDNGLGALCCVGAPVDFASDVGCASINDANSALVTMSSCGIRLDMTKHCE